MNPQLSWNLIDDVRQMLQFHFMVNALRAGTIVAVAAGAIGYLMVLRKQAFAGHTLALIGFPGAAGAVWLGLNPSIGFYAFCVVGALLIASLPVGSGSEQSALIGTVQAIALAAGFLFISLARTFLSGSVDLLFGTLIGITDRQVLWMLGASGLCLATFAVLGRPLLFATIDGDVAAARRVPVRLVGVAYLVLLGVAAAGTSQFTGSTLVFALLVGPAATATRLTANPVRGLTLSVLVAVVVTWLGEALAYFSPYPIGFWVTTFSFGLFVLVTGTRRMLGAFA